MIGADHGRIDPELLFDARPWSMTRGQLSFEDLLAEAADGEREQGDHTGHAHAAYESVEFVSEQSLSPRRFIDFLDRRPAGLYRIKGFVHFGVPGHDERYEVHAVGRFLRFAPGPWGRDEARVTRLVLIGSGTDGPALLRELEACREPRPHLAGPESMWGVLRYVARPRGRRRRTPPPTRTRTPRPIRTPPPTPTRIPPLRRPRCRTRAGGPPGRPGSPCRR